MSKPSIDGSKPEFRNNQADESSKRLTRDLNVLQQEIRHDFGHRMSGLTNLMNRFRALMVSDIRSLNAANAAATPNPTDNIPLLTKRVDDATLAVDQTIAPSDDIGADETLFNEQHATKALATRNLAALRETARFEAGLYQLNCQLYRFRLELDQELEYRNEPLHLHFNHKSELACVLQEITQKKEQEKNTGLG